MGITTLSIAEAVILERTTIDKRYIFSAAGFTTALDYVLVRIGEGDADIVLGSNGTTLVEITVPMGMAVYAWASAGTPEIATHAL